MAVFAGFRREGEKKKGFDVRSNRVKCHSVLSSATRATANGNLTCSGAARALREKARLRRTERTLLRAKAEP